MSTDINQVKYGNKESQDVPIFYEEKTGDSSSVYDFNCFIAVTQSSR